MDNEISTSELVRLVDEKTKDNLFNNNAPVIAEQSSKDKLIENVFEQAVINQVATNEDLKDKVLDTAQKYTETKMQTIATNVDTEHKEAVFNNAKDACESYGFNEKNNANLGNKLYESWIQYHFGNLVICGFFHIYADYFYYKKNSGWT